MVQDITVETAAWPLTARPVPAGEQAELWLFDLDRGLPPAAADLAPPRARRLMRHLFLRLLLAAYLAIPPRAIRLTRGRHGKPELAGAGGGRLAFNLTHTGPWLLVAAAARGPLGVDLENTARRIGNPLALARRYFAAAEYEALAALSPDRYHDAALRLWAAKEAVVKWHGGGLASGLDRFTIDTGTAGRQGELAPLSVSRSPADWPGIPHLWPLVPGPGLYAVLAAPPDIRRLAIYRVSGLPINR